MDSRPKRRLLGGIQVSGQRQNIARDQERAEQASAFDQEGGRFGSFWRSFYIAQFAMYALKSQSIFAGVGQQCSPKPISFIR